MTTIYLFQLNVHIVFEGEKEFHQNVKLWGVSIMNPTIFFPDDSKHFENEYSWNVCEYNLNVSVKILKLHKNGLRF